MCKRCLKNIDTDITIFVQYLDHDNNYSNNYNQDSNSGYDSNLNDGLLEPYLSDYNDLQINEIGNHNKNEDNKILDDYNIKNS